MKHQLRKKPDWHETLQPSREMSSANSVLLRWAAVLFVASNLSVYFFLHPTISDIAYYFHS